MLVYRARAPDEPHRMLRRLSSRTCQAVIPTRPLLRTVDFVTDFHSVQIGADAFVKRSGLRYMCTSFFTIRVAVICHPNNLASAV
jgi:hypothetical protein